MFFSWGWCPDKERLDVVSWTEILNGVNGQLEKVGLVFHLIYFDGGRSSY